MKKTDNHARLETSKLNTEYQSVWHHITLVLETNNWNFNVYHDGIKYDTQNLDTQQPRSAGSGNVVIGNQNSTHPPSSLGTGVSTTAPPYSERYGMIALDELVMWNRALSESQVSQIFQMES